MARRSFSQVFGEVVRRHRSTQDVSQENLAEIADLHRTHIGFIERGEMSPSIDVAHRIAAALGITFASLVADAEKQTPADSKLADRRRKLMRPRKRKPPN